MRVSTGTEVTPSLGWEPLMENRLSRPSNVQVSEKVRPERVFAGTAHARAAMLKAAFSGSLEQQTSDVIVLRSVSHVPIQFRQ